MSDKYLLVEHVSDLNSIVNQPLHLTQRIKFTCFDVSNNFIIFGATSGGLYIFQRYPCKFIKLIPSKEGPVILVNISPDEKNIALASTKGTIIIIKDFIVESTVQYHTYNEHEGNTVTAIKWHFNEIYCGDNVGKVSVVSVASALTKAIFQSPSATLMHLDSSIVQIDSFSYYLLVSTQIRTYLCHTEKEQYRKIGTKQRDGSYGACFYSSKQNLKTQEVPSVKTKRFFKNVKDDERLSLQNNSDVKIICARPGVRLWEANFDASVACTHQFRNTLNQPPSNVIQLTEKLDLHLHIEDYSDTNFVLAENFNFGKIFILAHKYIVSFNVHGFYIFDLESVSLVFWKYCPRNIKDIKVVKNFIYVYAEDHCVNVYSVQKLQNLILKTLINKQYYMCSELCVYFTDDIYKLIPNSNKIHLITILKEKLTELGAEELLKKLLPILNAIQEYSQNKFISEKLRTGIVLVQNVNAVESDVLPDFCSNYEVNHTNKYEGDANLPETLQALKEIGATVTDKLTESTRNLKEKWQILEVTVKNLTSDEKTKVNGVSSNVVQNNTEQPELINKTSDANEENEVVNENDILKLVHKQFQVSQLNRRIEVTKFYKVIETKCVDDAVDIFLNFMEYGKLENLKVDDVSMWCNRQFLIYLNKRQFNEEVDAMNLGSKTMNFLISAFKSLSNTRNLSCSCSFPLPTASSKKPEFYDIGCAIIKKLWNYEPAENICTEVPYMWKYVIKCLRCKDDIRVLLPLLIQFGDEELILFFIKKITYDTWDDAVNLLIKLKKMICLNCEQKFHKLVESISWSTFGNLMVQSIGGPSAIKLLLRYAIHIPSSAFDNNFYQHCIFSTAVDNLSTDLRDKAANFSKSIHTNKESSQQFQEMLEKFLHGNYMKRAPVKMVPKNRNLVISKCSICDLPVTITLLGDNVNLSCGHVSHKICLKHNNNTCKMCAEVLM